MNAYRNYNTNTSALAKNLEKLSSDYKIKENHFSREQVLFNFKPANVADH